jgi:hypothetical protein
MLLPVQLRIFGYVCVTSGGSTPWSCLCWIVSEWVVISLHETAADPPQQSILELPKKLLEPTFDNVSMQFCIHYAFEKVQNVRQMLENVAMYLREGGIYFGTTVSKDKIV